MLCTEEPGKFLPTFGHCSLKCCFSFSLWWFDMPKAYCTSIYLRRVQKNKIYSLNIIGAFFFRFDESSFGDIFACLSMARKVYLFAPLRLQWRFRTSFLEMLDHPGALSLPFSHVTVISGDFIGRFLNKKEETTRFFFRFLLLGLWGFPHFFGFGSSAQVCLRPCALAPLHAFRTERWWQRP